jgi:hypothetical protein
MHDEITINVVSYEPVRDGGPADRAAAPGRWFRNNSIVEESDCHYPR